MLPAHNRKSATGNPPPTVRAPVLDPTCESAGVRFPRATRPYIKVQGRWCYLYRAIDRAGNLVDARLSETRDLEAAKQFFAQALAVGGKPPERVTTDGHSAYPRAIRETLGKQVLHRCNP